MKTTDPNQTPEELDARHEELWSVVVQPDATLAQVDEFLELDREFKGACDDITEEH